MPRVAGLNVVAVLIAALALYFVGFLFYGLIFAELWQQQTLENHGLVAPGEGAALTGQALMDAMLQIPGALPMGTAMGLGIVISLVTAVGLTALQGMVKPASLMGAVGVGLVAWVGFAATTLGYNVVYSSESKIIFVIDLAHLLIGYTLASAAIYLIDGKSRKAA